MWPLGVIVVDVNEPLHKRIEVGRTITQDLHKQLAARGECDRVRSIVGDLMEPQDVYPERWRVREYPNEAMIEQIGMLLQSWKGQSTTSKQGSGTESTLEN